MKTSIVWLIVLAGCVLGCTLGCLSGCAGDRSGQPGLRESEYRRIAELQRQKSILQSAEEPAVQMPEPKSNEYERLGDGYLIRGNAIMAFTQYTKALQLDPGRTAIRNKIGRLFLQRGLVDESAKEFETVLKAEPRDAAACAQAYEGLGRCSLARRDLDRAMEYLTTAVRIAPGLWRAHEAMGHIHVRRGEYDRALARYAEAVAIRPDSATLLNNLGMTLYLQGHYERALGVLVRASRIEPENSALFNNIGLCLGKLGRYPDAFRAFRKAGSEAAAFNNMGNVYMAAGRFDEAIAHFEKAFELEPTYYAKARDNIDRARELSRRTGASK